MKASLLLFFMYLLCAGAHGANVHFVDVNSGNPVSPYADWSTAATNIQDAIDAAVDGDQILVTNGVYKFGGRVAPQGSGLNRVLVTNSLIIESVNGPAVTVIDGRAAVRCAHLASGTLLTGFMLTNGLTSSITDNAGGGVWCESTATVISNCWLLGNGPEYTGGGAWSGTLIDCTLSRNSAHLGGATRLSTLINCALLGNFATSGSCYGGAAYEGMLINCVLASNVCSYCGGAAYQAALTNCVVCSNSASAGGGAFGCTMDTCIITNNSASNGGGVQSGAAFRCIISGNSALNGGGGAYYTATTSSEISGNSATYGGGTCSVQAFNCNIADNSATQTGGGAYNSTLTNCIVYFNQATNEANCSGCKLNYCCTTPMPADGVGNISTDPLLASASHLGTGSPCRGAGNPSFSNGVDLDGEPWANPPAIGCNEYLEAGATGPLSVAFKADHTYVPTGFNAHFQAQITGPAIASSWDFGDGTVITNSPFPSHSWSRSGDFQVILQAFNDTYTKGVDSRLTVGVVTQLVHYVALSSTNPVPPYRSWDTATTNIQAAVDVATIPGSLILVSNGVYQSGGRAVWGTLTNRVAVTQPITLESANGPGVTVISGYQVPGSTNADVAVRCIYLTNDTALVGFTLSQGATRGYGADSIHEQSGGGVWCESTNAVVSNCWIVANSAYSNAGGVYLGTFNNCTFTGNSAQYYGGAAYLGTFNNCVFTGNSAQRDGGAAYSGRLNYCVLRGNSSKGYGGGAGNAVLNGCLLANNSAVYGGATHQSMLAGCTIVSNAAAYQAGGALYGTLNNCINYYNSAPLNPNWASTYLNYCCTTPANGRGGIANPPGFVNLAAGDFHLAPDSPCINSGNNPYVTTTADLDGDSRITGGTVDIGAYEFQSPTSLISYAWLQQYGLPTDGSVDFADPDGDGMNNWQEWNAGTNPTNAASVLRMVSVTNSPSGAVVTWQTVTIGSYFLQRASDLGAQPAFVTLATNLAGWSGGYTQYTDTNATGRGPYLYRVGAHLSY